MSKREPDTHNVVPNPDGGWDVRRGGAERSDRQFDTKAKAINRGREISRDAGTEYKITIATAGLHSPTRTATIRVTSKAGLEGGQRWLS